MARRVERLERLAAELGNAAVIPTNLADAAARDALAATVDGGERAVEVLVNSAGLGVYEPFYRSSRERELEQVRVLAEAPMDLAPTNLTRDPPR